MIARTLSTTAALICAVPADTLAQDRPGSSGVTAREVAGAADVLRLRVAPRRIWAPRSFEMVRGVVLFEAIIGGRQATVLFDSGTGKTAIDTAFARAIELNLDKATGYAATGSGPIPFSRTASTTFEVPRAFTLSGRLVSFDMRSISDALGQRIDAILGADALAMMAVMIRPKTGQISFISSGAIKFSGPDVIYLPLSPQGLVEATVNGSATTLMIDTGYSGSVRLTERLWNKIFGDDAPNRSSSVATTADGGQVRAMSAYGNISLGNSPGINAPVSSGYRSIDSKRGLLGTGILLRGDLLIDVPDGKLALISKRNR